MSSSEDDSVVENLIVESSDESGANDESALPAQEESESS